MKFFKKAFLLSLVLIAVVVTLTSCSGKKKVSLSAEKSEISVIIGETFELKLSATEVKKFTEADILSNLDFNSSNDSIVKVENGCLKAVGLGTADVTATWKEYDKAKVTVKVNVLAPEVGSVTYSSLPEHVYVGDTFSITHEASNDVTVSYESSNEEILSVNGNNFVAKDKGTVKVTATATNGYKEVKQEWDVTVEQGEFTITYVLNGGTNATSNPAKYDVRELPLILAAATKENKIFLGWTIEENSTDYVTEIAAGSTGDITLYAQFEDIVLNITYQLNGGVNPTDAPETFIQGESVQLPVPTKTNKKFLGWTKEENSTDYITEISAETTTNVTVYAQFEDIVLNITYELDGGVNPTDAPNTFVLGEGVKLPTPTKDGYKFLGWKLNGSGSYITEISSKLKVNCKVVAYWEKLIVYSNIVYELNGGVNPDGAATTYAEGTGCTLPVPTRDGYKFLGWTKEATGNTYISAIPADATGEFKVYAQWEQMPSKFSIEYELNGGTNANDAVSEYETGVAVKLPVPTRDGYKFLGWTKDASSTTYVTEVGANEKEDLKLYAQWIIYVEGAVYVGEGLDYATLDEAVVGVNEDATIILPAGEYQLTTVIDKNVTILGPNANLEVTSFQEAEAVITVKKDVAKNLAAKNIVFNGVHIKGTGGGPGIPGVYFQDGGNIETLVFKSCVVSDMNTFIKFVGGTSSLDLNIENCYIHTIGQFILWTTTSLKTATLMGNRVDGLGCGGVTNANAALFRVRFGKLVAYNNYFYGDSSNAPGYFECSDASAETSVVKYNTFENVTKFTFATATHKLLFDENLYLNADGNVLDKVPAGVTGTGVTADTTICSNEDDRYARYIKELISLYPDRYFLVNFDLDGGEFTSNYPVAYDKELGIQSLPTVEREEYIFAGWYLNGEKVESIPVGTTGNLTLVARWRDTALVVDGTTAEGHYESLSAALAAVKSGEKIKLVAGEYDENVTISVPNVTIVGPNVGVSGTDANRAKESVLKGVITIETSASNLTVDGLAFTGAAKFVYSATASYDGFIFQNNKVYDTTEATNEWDESRYTLPAFIQFTMSSSSGKLSNVQIFNNSFVNVSEVNVLANRCENVTVDGNVFKDFDLDAIRIEGGNCYGAFGFTNNVFEQTTALNGAHGIYFRAIAGANEQQPTHVIIKNNSFIKLGKDTGTVFTGAISSYSFQENYTEFVIENNIFDHCYDYLYLRNNGGDASIWKCTVENNQFLGLPTNQYYGSYRGSDSESTNPHLAVFTQNYYEDNAGNVITDLSTYAAYFKHMASYGTALSSKPGAVVVEPVEFWTISYDLNGGSSNGSFVYNYTSLNSSAIALPVVTLVNHQFNGWLLNGELVTEIPADASGNLYLVADFTVLEGELYTIEFVTNKQNVIWPSRPAVDRQEIINTLLADLYEWAKGNGETRSYEEYVTYITGKIAAYDDINLRNTKLGNYPAEDGSTEYFFNVPKYYQKWNEFFAVFHTAMQAVNATQTFYTDTYATMVRLHQFIAWTSTGQGYFNSYLNKMCAVTKIPQEIPTNYRGGQVVQLPELSLANGLKFLGWYDNAGFTGSPITSITAIDSGDKVYYAKWEDEIKVEKVEINKISELLLFETHQLVWTLTPANATDLSVEFFSSDESVATVNARGLITALANGKTTITMKVYGNRELDVVFELEVYTNDYINGEYDTESYVLVDGSIKLLAEVIRKDGSKGTVKWSSLTPDTATVDENGVVTALNAGTAKIVATDASNDNLKLEFVVTVLESLPTDILGLALNAHESNTFVRYDLNIGGVYNKDILGSVSKLLGTSPLTKNTKYYEASNTSSATFGTMESIEFITVHYTGNMAAGADAAANANYFATNGSTSIHYTTGNDGVFYCLDESKSAWHAGDSGALAQVGKFEWIKSGVKVAAGDPQYPVFTISDDFYYEINGQKTSIPMPKPWNYSSRNTDHILNADGTISSQSGYKQTGFTNRTPESFINDQGLPFKIVDGEYYMGTTWWAYTQVYEGRICSTGGNRNSIGIESCVNEGSDLWWTWQKTAQLVADLMVRHNLDITRVRGHHFYTAKNCPQPMLENDQEIWYEFLELVEAEYELLTKYQGYEVSIVSNNPDIVDNYGRVIKQPSASTCVTYTITFTKDGESKSITLASMVDGRYVNR